MQRSSHASRVAGFIASAAMTAAAAADPVLTGASGDSSPVFLGRCGVGIVLPLGEADAIQRMPAPCDEEIRPGDIVVMPADVTGDGIIDYSDMLAFFDLWDAEDPSVDLTADGLVDWSDYLIFINYYELAAQPAAPDCTRDGVIDIRDLDAFLYWIDAFDSRADLTADGILDFSDVLEFLNRYDAAVHAAE